MVIVAPTHNHSGCVGCQVRPANAQGKTKNKWLTVKKTSRKINTYISIPSRLPPPLHSPRNLLCFHLLNADQDTILVPETNNNLWDAKEKGLDPEFHKLALKSYEVSVGLWRDGRFQFDPIYARVRGSGFDVPN